MELDFLYFLEKPCFKITINIFNFYLKDMNFFRAVDQFDSMIVQYDIIQNNLVIKILVKFTKKIEIDNFFELELNYEIA